MGAHYPTNLSTHKNIQIDLINTEDVCEKAELSSFQEFMNLTHFYTKGTNDHFLALTPR